MPLIQGGPPEWIWERTPDLLKSEIVEVNNPDGHRAFEVRISCGVEIVRLQFFTSDELRKLGQSIAAIRLLQGGEG